GVKIQTDQRYSKRSTTAAMAGLFSGRACQHSSNNVHMELVKAAGEHLDRSGRFPICTKAMMVISFFR
ncbi:hypothetical protein PILCRDRAFT_830242, partial [Piloderma croceum F 1598]